MSTPTAPLAALTTVFTPPCATSWLLTTTKVPSQYPPFPTSGPSSCDPPSWQANIEDEGFQYYSPAICPSGFEVGPNCQVTKTRTAEGFPAITNGETAVYCVPSGHTCTTDTTDFRGGVWGFTRAAATVTVGPALQIRFREEDLAILETHPLTPGLILAGAATSTGSIEAAQTSTSIAGFSTITRQATTTTPGNLVVSESLGTNADEADTATNSVVSSLVVSGSQSVTLETKATETTSSTSNSGSQPMNPGSLAAIILSSILAAVILVISSFIVIRRRNRRNRHNNSLRVLPLRQKPWLWRDGDGGAGSRSSVSSVASIVLPFQRAELSDHAPVLPELAPNTPFGAKENPAELHGRGLAAELNGGAAAPSTTWSWMSRASKQWSAKSMRTRSSIGQSSFRWTRSAASMQTASSGRYSGDWQSFARGKWGSEGLGLPVFAADRPLPDVPKTPGSAKPHIASYLKPDYDLNRLSRISDGTFGAPGMSPISPRFNRP